MNVVSRRYARALIDALPTDRAGSGLIQLRQLSEILSSEPDARKLLMNPGVPPENRERLIARLGIAMELEKPVQKLFSLLVERRRLEVLDEVADACEQLLDERVGIVRVQVTSTGSFSEAEQRELRRRLEESTGKQIVMEVDQDPSIIGGLVVRIGGTVMDASLRQQLAGFEQQLRAD